MGQLIKKDFRLLYRIEPLVIVLLFGFIMNTSDQPISFAAALIAIFLVINIAQYEDKNESRTFLNSLPNRRIDIVKVKYLEGFIFGVIGYAAAFVMKLPFTIITENTVSFSVFIVLVSMMTVLFMLAIFYPVYFAFGMVATYVSTFAFVVVLMFLRPFIYMLSTPNQVVFSIVLIICMAFYVLSYSMANSIYAKKDL
ncbi:ABC-2 transporter permease [Lentibacillus amyloliquefaciens]|uniref:ABC-2 transporter permease n=1 Tax=Lentibacillus amyloliquefaciens TaxID=1472767 RepID=A0A0U4E690_9BACI|nr:ABC-2 transporter permease [Lentibacillus amyloliquefaciens]ALX48796.1 hypothetical protein AOX59_09315 [Lentibacillus amyloliquefaciens]